MKISNGSNKFIEVSIGHPDSEEPDVVLKLEPSAVRNAPTSDTDSLVIREYKPKKE